MAADELPENLRYLIEEFNRSGLRELHLRKGDFELLLSHADHAARLPVDQERPAVSQTRQSAAPRPANPAAKPETVTADLPELSP